MMKEDKTQLVFGSVPNCNGCGLMMKEDKTQYVYHAATIQEVVV